MAITMAFQLTGFTTEPDKKRSRGVDGKWLKDSKGNYIYEDCLKTFVNFTPVYHKGDDTHINSKFWDGRTAGLLQLAVTDLEAVKELQMGKEYTIEIKLRQ